MKRIKKTIHHAKRSLRKSDHYDKLPRGAYFRYLILQPGTGDEPLQCSLHTAHLPSEPPYEPFEAISYVWGTDIRDKVVLCNGHVLNITTNLFKVLQRVRRSDAPRKLWADSICINQDDLKEKGHQVANMGQIYRAAESVLIYIGSDDAGHGPSVCSLLDEVNAMIEDTYKKIDISCDKFPYLYENERLLTDPRWHSWRTLLRQEWFKRGWVVREAAFAQHGHVIWGQSEFAWESLMRIYMWLRRRVPGDNRESCPSWIDLNYSAYRERNKSFAQAFYPKVSWPPLSTLLALEYARHLQVSDPRDRIFAFTDLSLTFKREMHLYPNYKDSHLEVYRQFTLQYIQATKDLHILDYVTHDTRTLDSDSPSWVPRWDISTFPVGGVPTLRRASAMTSRDRFTPVPRTINRVTLQVRGIVMDNVQYASNVFRSSKTTPELIQGVWKSVKLATTKSPYEASHLLSIFLDTLCLAKSHGEWTNWVQSRAAFIALARLTYLDMDGAELSPESVFNLRKLSRVFYHTAKEFTVGSRFIVTKRGYMGLAPPNTEVGDACGIIFGCNFPCILRCAPHRDHYRHLGATYLTGKESRNLQPYAAGDGSEGAVKFGNMLGSEESKDWLDWDVEEQDLCLC